MSVITTWLRRAVVIILVLGIPFVALGGHRTIRGAGADSVSSASKLDLDEDKLSGRYVVFINEDLHDAKDTLPLWKQFFSGEDVPVIMDDISCIVADADEPALEFARLCQARLPENQMKVRTETGIIAVSKIQCAKFDIAIMSDELAEKWKAKSIADAGGVTMVEVK